MAETMLVADIGGTNARFAIATGDGKKIEIDHIEYFRAEDFETPQDAAHAYLESVRINPEAACFAIAAPVGENSVSFTNSHWSIDVAETKKTLKLQRFDLINDFHALAAGVGYMPVTDFVQIHEAKGVPTAPTVVIGPGTGLGQALIVPQAQSSAIIATEGGHVSFSATTDEEIEVLKFIRQEHPRVSVERVLSGRGLVNIHRALCALKDVPRISLRADQISKAALTKEYPVAVEAVTMFCSILGNAVGDAVLSTGARGGIVLGGGILPKILPFFLESPFLSRLHNKGRMSAYVRAVPVRLIVGEGAALYGAGAVLQQRLSTG